MFAGDQARSLSKLNWVESNMKTGEFTLALQRVLLKGREFHRFAVGEEMGAGRSIHRDTSRAVSFWSIPAQRALENAYGGRCPAQNC